jgi:uncharacterized membrane protein (UPF0127 family)
MGLRTVYLAVALGTVLLTGACASGDAAAGAAEAKNGKVALTIKSRNGAHAFKVEVAKTPAEQEKGLMFRTNIPKDEGMIFSPYPGEGGPPRDANFWMKNTPSPLDIIFIRADGTIARIAENTVPFSEVPIPSGEPVAAVLEINGGEVFGLARRGERGCRRLSPGC